MNGLRPFFLDRMVHCLVLVLSVADACHEETYAFFDQCLKLAEARGIGVIAVITHVDDCDPVLNLEPELTYESELLHADIRVRVAERTGLPLRDILLVRNYLHEMSACYAVCKSQPLFFV